MRKIYEILKFYVLFGVSFGIIGFTLMNLFSFVAISIHQIF